MVKRRDKQAVTKPVDDPAEAQRKEEKMARRELIFSHLNHLFLFILIVLLLQSRLRQRPRWQGGGINSHNEHL